MNRALGRPCARLLRLLEAPADQPGTEQDLPLPVLPRRRGGARTGGSGRRHLRVAGERARADLDARRSPDSTIERSCSPWAARRRRRPTARHRRLAEDVLLRVAPSQRAERVEAQPAQRIGQIHEAEVLHPAPLRERRSFDGQPLDLADEKASSTGIKQVAVDPGKRPGPPGIQGDGLGRLDVEGDLDLVRRDEVHRADRAGSRPARRESGSSSPSLPSSSERSPCSPSPAQSPTRLEQLRHAEGRAVDRRLRQVVSTSVWRSPRWSPIKSVIWACLPSVSYVRMIRPSGSPWR